VRGQQKVFETARQRDVVVAALVAALGVGISVALLSFVGFWGIIVAPVIGGGIGEVVRWAIRRRRSARIFWSAAAGGAFGGVVCILVLLLPRYGWLFGSGAGMSAMVIGRIALDLLWPAVDTILMVTSIYYRLRGIQL
jgi:hypothetical protein